MTIDKRVLAAAKVIAENDDACRDASAPCVNEAPGSPDECSCMRTARIAISAAEHAEPIVCEFIADSGTTYRLTVAGPQEIRVEKATKS